MAYDAETRTVYFGEDADRAAPARVDGHYSLQADEADAAHLRFGNDEERLRRAREHVPVRALSPNTVEFERPQERL